MKFNSTNVGRLLTAGAFVYTGTMLLLSAGGLFRRAINK